MTLGSPASGDGAGMGFQVYAAVFAASSEAVLITDARGITVDARLGGDEFALLLPGFGHQRALAVIAQRLLATLASPYHLEHTSVAVSASLGLVAAGDVSADGRPEGPEAASILLSMADAAMYEAKARGKNTYAIAQPRLP